MAISGLPPIPTDPGAQLAQYTLALTNGDVPKALFYLTDALVRIANGAANPREVAEVVLRLVNDAIPAPPAPATPVPPKAI